jgi:integrase
MERVKLTPGRIDEAGCKDGKKQSFLWDTENPRLAVRITANGAKSFIFEAKLDRATIRCTIGSTKAWTIKDARKEANSLQALIDRGIDPRELERDLKEQALAEKSARAEAEKLAKDRQRYTLKALLNEYVKHLEAKGKKKSAAAAASAFKCHVLEPHPEVSNTPANEVTADQISVIVRQVFKQGKERTAGILRSYLSAAYNAAKKARFHADLPEALVPFKVDINPVEPVGAIPVKAGKRHLPADELKAYIASLGDDLNDLALKLALYAGGQRMAQLLRANVSDYDPATKTLRLLDGKGKRKEPRVHVVPLGPAAAGIADKLLEDAEKAKSVFLFASRGSVVHYSTPGKRVKEISDAMGGEPFDLRDIRRTAETMLAGLGISKDNRAQLLSHGLTGVQDKHYDQHIYLREKRSALLKWERHLKNIITGKTASKVVNLRGA